MLGYISSLPKTEQRLIKYGRGKPERHLEVKRERKEKGVRREENGEKQNMVSKAQVWRQRPTMLQVQKRAGSSGWNSSYCSGLGTESAPLRRMAQLHLRKLNQAALA